MISEVFFNARYAKLQESHENAPASPDIKQMDTQMTIDITAYTLALETFTSADSTKWLVRTWNNPEFPPV